MKKCNLILTCIFIALFILFFIQFCITAADGDWRPWTETPIREIRHPVPYFGMLGSAVVACITIATGKDTKGERK